MKQLWIVLANLDNMRLETHTIPGVISCRLRDSLAAEYDEESADLVIEAFRDDLTILLEYIARQLRHCFEERRQHAQQQREALERRVRRWQRFAVIGKLRKLFRGFRK